MYVIYDQDKSISIVFFEQIIQMYFNNKLFFLYFFFIFLYGCSSVSLLHIFRTRFSKTPTEGYFCREYYDEAYWNFNMNFICFSNFNFTERIQILKFQLWKLYNNKYMIASTQITRTEISAFMAVLVFKLLDRKVLLINRKDNRNC